MQQPSSSEASLDLLNENRGSSKPFIMPARTFYKRGSICKSTWTQLINAAAIGLSDQVSDQGHTVLEPELYRSTRRPVWPKRHSGFIVMWRLGSYAAPEQLVAQSMRLEMSAHKALGFFFQKYTVISI